MRRLLHRTAVVDPGPRFPRYRRGLAMGEIESAVRSNPFPNGRARRTKANGRGIRSPRPSYPTEVALLGSHGERCAASGQPTAIRAALHVGDVDDRAAGGRYAEAEVAGGR